MLGPEGPLQASREYRRGTSRIYIPYKTRTWAGGNARRGRDVTDFNTYESSCSYSSTDAILRLPSASRWKRPGQNINHVTMQCLSRPRHSTTDLVGEVASPSQGERNVADIPKHVFQPSCSCLRTACQGSTLSPCR